MTHNAESTLTICSFIIMILSWIGFMYKGGNVSLLRGSLKGNSRPKYEFDKSKVGKFIATICIAIALNLLFACLITHQARLIIEFTLFNMVFIAWTSVHWILFKEKKA